VQAKTQTQKDMAKLIEGAVALVILGSLGSLFLGALYFVIG